MQSFGTASEIINSEVKKHPESCAQSGIELHPHLSDSMIYVGQMGVLYYVKRKTETYSPIFTLNSLRFAQSVDNLNTLNKRLIFRLNRTVIVLDRRIITDFIHNIHALGHIAEAGVLTVEIGAVLLNDEELRGCAVRVA